MKPCQAHANHSPTPEECPVVQKHVIVCGIRVSLGSDSVITVKMFLETGADDE
jgi:hypothetical protein